MSDPANISDEENWSGGFYELAIELGQRSDDRLQRALDTLCRLVEMAGCFRRFPSIEAVPRTLDSLERFGHLTGVVRLPSGPRVVCGLIGHRLEEGTDWLTFYVPLGALGQTDARIKGFPFGKDGGPDSLAWRHPIDEWLTQTAIRAYSEFEYRLALVGFEVDDASLDLDDGVPEQRYFNYIIPNEHGGLRTHAANR